MKKFIVLFSISFIVFACSHKTTSSTSSSVEKTSSATVSHTQFMEGKAVFEANCQKCHKLKEPADHTPEQWSKILDKMAPKAKLTDEQKQQVFNFVSVNAKSS
ncbi:MAG: hypothetical protein JWN78_2981 [Bacteroidota bacterium]|nr:hypothetical protein [Bacteroidota bacterium]